jgi:hypothetical protein
LSRETERRHNETGNLQVFVFIFSQPKKIKIKIKIKKVTAHQALNGSMYFYTRQQAGFAFM